MTLYGAWLNALAIHTFIYSILLKSRSCKTWRFSNQYRIILLSTMAQTLELVWKYLVKFVRLKVTNIATSKKYAQCSLPPNRRLWKCLLYRTWRLWAIRVILAIDIKCLSIVWLTAMLQFKSVHVSRVRDKWLPDTSRVAYLKGKS